MLATLPRRLREELGQSVAHLADGVGALDREFPGEVAAACGIDHLQDALDLDAKFLRLLPLAFGGFADLAFVLQLFGDQFPGDHRAQIVLVPVVNGRDQQVGCLRPDVDVGANGQILGVAEQLALMRRVLVEDVDARPQHVLRRDGQVPFDLLQRGKRGGVHVGDF